MLPGRHLRLGLLIALAGCTQYWAKPGGTAAELGAARADCEAQANARFPPLMQPALVSSGTPSPMATTCAPAGPTVVCTTAGTGFRPPAYTTLDRNTGPRKQALEACLSDAGWSPVRTKAEASAITSSGR
jgi:hypothetical protein